MKSRRIRSYDFSPFKAGSFWKPGKANARSGGGRGGAGDFCEIIERDGSGRRVKVKWHREDGHPSRPSWVSYETLFTYDLQRFTPGLRIIDSEQSAGVSVEAAAKAVSELAHSATFIEPTPNDAPRAKPGPKPLPESDARGDTVAVRMNEKEMEMLAAVIAHHQQLADSLGLCATVGAADVIRGLIREAFKSSTKKAAE